MFKVIVLACAIASDACWEYHDTRGPYSSTEQCTARAYEMGNAIMEINKGAIEPKQFKCVQLKGTAL